MLEDLCVRNLLLDPSFPAGAANDVRFHEKLATLRMNI